MLNDISWVEADLTDPRTASLIAKMTRRNKVEDGGCGCGGCGGGGGGGDGGGGGGGDGGGDGGDGPAESIAAAGSDG